MVVRVGDPRLHRFELVVRGQGIDLGGKKDVKVEGIKVTNTLEAAKEIEHRRSAPGASRCLGEGRAP